MNFAIAVGGISLALFTLGFYLTFFMIFLFINKEPIAALLYSNAAITVRIGLIRFLGPLFLGIGLLGIIYAATHLP